MKGFETRNGKNRKYSPQRKKECPAMKGFETWIARNNSSTFQTVRRNAPL